MDAMGFTDAVFHLINFLLPALTLAVLLPTLARLLWWRRLRAVAWTLLARRVALCGVAVLLAGVVVLGRDGEMATYAALAVGAALTVWWTGFRGRA